MAHNGIQNLFYLESKGAFGNDHEGTVDGVHFTDLGFLRYADYFCLLYTSPSPRD